MAGRVSAEGYGAKLVKGTCMVYMAGTMASVGACKKLLYRLSYNTMNFMNANHRPNPDAVREE